MDEHETDTIVHFAAESHDRRLARPDAFIRTNLEGTHTLGRGRKRGWAGRGERPVYPRVDEVYGSLAPEDPARRRFANQPTSLPIRRARRVKDHLVALRAHLWGQAFHQQLPEELRALPFSRKADPVVLNADSRWRRDPRVR